MGSFGKGNFAETILQNSWPGPSAEMCRGFLLYQKPGNHPNFEKNALGVERPFSEQLSEFREFSEQFSEWQSRPNACENPILGATLGPTLRIGWTPKFQPKFSELFFLKIGVVPARGAPDCIDCGGFFWALSPTMMRREKIWRRNPAAQKYKNPRKIRSAKIRP